MLNQIGRKLHSNDQVNGLAIRLTQVEHTPCQRPAHDLRRGIPLEWQRYHFRQVACFTECAPQSLDVRLASPARKRNLCRANENVTNRQ